MDKKTGGNQKNNLRNIIAHYNFNLDRPLSSGAPLKRSATLYDIPTSMLESDKPNEIEEYDKNQNVQPEKPKRSPVPIISRRVEIVARAEVVPDKAEHHDHESVDSNGHHKHHHYEHYTHHEHHSHKSKTPVPEEEEHHHHHRHSKDLGNPEDHHHHRHSHGGNEERRHSHNHSKDKDDKERRKSKEHEERHKEHGHHSRSRDKQEESKAEEEGHHHKRHSHHHSNSKDGGEGQKRHSHSHDHHRQSKDASEKPSHEHRHSEHHRHSHDHGHSSKNLEGHQGHSHDHGHSKKQLEVKDSKKKGKHADGKSNFLVARYIAEGNDGSESRRSKSKSKHRDRDIKAVDDVIHAIRNLPPDIFKEKSKDKYSSKPDLNSNTLPNDPNAEHRVKNKLPSYVFQPHDDAIRNNYQTFQVTEIKPDSEMMNAGNVPSASELPSTPKGVATITKSPGSKNGSGSDIKSGSGSGSKSGRNSGNKPRNKSGSKTGSKSGNSGSGSGSSSGSGSGSGSKIVKSERSSVPQAQTASPGKRVSGESNLDNKKDGPPPEEDQKNISIPPQIAETGEKTNGSKSPTTASASVTTNQIEEIVKNEMGDAVDITAMRPIAILEIDSSTATQATRPPNKSLKPDESRIAGPFLDTKPTKSMTITHSPRPTFIPPPRESFSNSAPVTVVNNRNERYIEDFGNVSPTQSGGEPYQRPAKMPVQKISQPSISMTDKGAIRFQLPGKVTHKTTIKVAHFPENNNDTVVVDVPKQPETEVICIPEDPCQEVDPCDPCGFYNNQNFSMNQLQQYDQAYQQYAQAQQQYMSSYGYMNYPSYGYNSYPYGYGCQQPR